MGARSGLAMGKGPVSPLLGMPRSRAGMGDFLAAFSASTSMCFSRAARLVEVANLHRRALEHTRTLAPMYQGSGLSRGGYVSSRSNARTVSPI